MTGQATGATSKTTAAGTSLTAETTLHVADGLSIERVNGVFQLSLGQRRLRGDRYTLPILDVFSRPTTVKQGLEDLDSRIKGTPGWVEVIAHVKALHQLGVLVTPGLTAGLRRAHEKRFDSAPVHAKMLDDEKRTASFQSAVRRLVEPGDVVLDIGTGTGVLAVTAARAGARRVYAVEATPMSTAARRLAETNGVGDRVTVIEAHSFDVDLPERADVLVSEIIGDDPLGEQILPTFEDARARLLTGEARIIPSRVQVCALPLEVPAKSMERFRFTAARATAWTERYGLDFSGLASTSEESDHLVHVNSHETRHWKRLSGPVLVADVDLLSATTQAIDRELVFAAHDSGSLSGVLLFFAADLAPGIRLSLHPDDATASNSWGNLLYLLARPCDVVRNQEIFLRYRYEGHRSRVEVIDGS